MSNLFEHKDDSMRLGELCIHALRMSLEESFTEQQALDLVAAMLYFKNHEEPIMRRYGAAKDGDCSG